MKKIMTSVVAVLLCCGVALAAEKTVEKGAEKAADKASCPAGKKAAKCTINGTIESIDVAAMKLVVKDSKGGLKDVVLAADTAISGKAKTLAEIVVGSSVQVKMVGDAVKSVNIKKLPKAAKAPKAEKVEKK